MKTQLRDSEDVFFVRINVHIVRWTGQSRRLNVRANWRRIIALDVAFVLCSETFHLVVIPREVAASAADVYRVSTDEFFFVGILQVLPSGHPAHGGIRDVVRSSRLAEQPR